jgi:1,4-dihydroxy-2-naphthoate octaprenyltransferase
MIKTWFQETRPQFLTLSVVLAILGTAIAAYDGYFNLWYALLAFLGLLLTHISVNTLNDYFDYKSGIDLKTQRTPFSGGSGIIPANMMKPKQVLWLGIITFVLAIPIGIYFTIVSGWMLLPLLVVAAICILFYTNVILKTPYPEWAAGLGLGFLPVMGMYFVQTGEFNWHIVVASIPSGILVYNLLFLNEFPDLEADRAGGRKTFPVLSGLRASSIQYTVMTAIMYVWIIAWSIAGIMPILSLISLLTIPFAVKAIRGALNYSDMNQLIPGMANNVMVILITQLLLAIAYIATTVYMMF